MTVNTTTIIGRQALLLSHCVDAAGFVPIESSPHNNIFYTWAQNDKRFIVSFKADLVTLEAWSDNNRIVSFRFAEPYEEIVAVADKMITELLCPKPVSWIKRAFRKS